jgi:hypothetical protein
MLHRHTATGRASVRVILVLIIVASAMWGASCGGELDPSEPEGAYYIFRDALLEGDVETVWERSDEETHQYFEERYERLVEMDEMIERYLPQTDHRIARQQSGTVLLDEIDGGKALFLKVFEPEGLPDEEAIRIGTDVKELKLAEDDSAAKVVTRAGQEYVLTHQDDTDQWHVMLVRSTETVEAALGWLESNQSALQQTVEDLIAEERQRRETIIADLMDIKDE